MELTGTHSQSPGIAIVGCGLIGAKRAQFLGGLPVVTCFDIEPERARRLADRFPPAHATTRLESALTHPGVDVVIVATSNDTLAPIAATALRAGKHVLLEKPAGRHPRELDEVRQAALHSGRLVRVGFNHRYHPAMRQAKQIIEAGEIGDLMFLRGRYGHGGRLGYDQEWRAQPEISGGGELIDQGVHLIDLARWFLGELRLFAGTAHTYFWNMPVDDNAFLILEASQAQTALLHVSCSEWKNLFCLEVYGKTGKLQIDGLGGSYGVERLTLYRMLPEMGPPDTTSWEFPRGDDSWAVEFQTFIDDIRLGRKPEPGLDDARAALEIVHQVYAGPGNRCVGRAQGDLG